MLDPYPPAWQAVQDPVSWAIALVVVAAVAVVVLLLSRREGPPDPRLLAAAPGVGAEPDERVAGLGDLEAAGEAMIDAGYSVTGVRTALNDIARVNEKPLTEIVVLPTALFVSTRRSGEMRTGTVSAGHEALVLNQIDALHDVIRAARS
ncbi:MAG TPA: threonine/serine exporter family protein, partial [Arachnia sp.]|nr:threonine/serine exporter family protein [Arachnia sp.]